MKKFTMTMAALTIAALAQAQNLSDCKIGIVLGYENETAVDVNRQEKAALDWITKECPSVKVFTPSNISTLSTSDVNALWVHTDRIAIGSGWRNLPSALSDANTVKALREYNEAGGALLLTKHATQLATAIGVIDKEVNCFADGEGGEGTDNWTVQAVLGAAPEFESLDRSGHPIYASMETNTDFGHESFPLLGTGNPETSLWREDHNCFWIPADLGFGTGNNDVNCVKEFENAYSCTVLGTWGHVTDYCGAGIIDFAPEGKGHVITIGLAAYELSPRNGGNAYTANIDKLTANSLSYLVNSALSGVGTIVDTETESAPEYYTLQGVRIENPSSGQICIERRGTTARKIMF